MVSEQVSAAFVSTDRCNELKSALKVRIERQFDYLRHNSHTVCGLCVGLLLLLMGGWEKSVTAQRKAGLRNAMPPSIYGMPDWNLDERT